LELEIDVNAHAVGADAHVVVMHKIVHCRFQAFGQTIPAESRAIRGPETTAAEASSGWRLG
jgi:hypothetical protein